MGGGGRVYAAARRHSSFVRALRIVIPAVAVMAVLIVGALTFFNPFGRIPGLTVGPISFAGSKIAMERPKLTGFRKDNRAYEVTATTAFQDIRNPNVIELKELNARLATDDAGGTARLVAQEGVFDTGKEHLELRRDIRIWTEKGEEVLMRSASVDFKAGTAVSSEPVQVRTPTMQLDAETLDAADGGKVMAFVGRVHVTIIPGQGNTPAAADQPAPPPATPRPLPDDGPKVVDATPVPPVMAMPPVAIAAPSPAPPRPTDLRAGPSRPAEPRSAEPRATARGGSSRETPPRYTQAEPPPAMTSFPGTVVKAALVAGLAAGLSTAHAAAAPSGKGSAHGMGELGSSREPIAIDADRLDVYDREGRAVFAGNVIAVQGETKMRCSVMNVFYEPKRGAKGATDAAGTADKPEAAPTPSPASIGSGLSNDSAIKKIECKGPVTITTKTQTATGDRAEFDRVINKVFLIGNAALTDGPNVTRGERVAYDVSTGVANIEGGRVKALIVPSSQKDKDAKPKR